MNIKTEVRTTHWITLEPEEWFEVKLMDDRVVSVDHVDVVQNGQDRWDVHLRGNRILKSGAFGKRLNAGTWEHSHSFNDAARAALWQTLPLALRETLIDRGVTV